MTQDDKGAIDWDAIYWEQAPRLYNFFRYRIGDSDIAQDLTSRTMLKAWRYRESYKDNLGAFAAWLFQIARNVAHDYFVEQAKEPLRLFDMQHLQADLSVEHEVDKRRDAAMLYSLLSKLDKREQDIIALKYGADMTNRDIANVLDMSESNVGTILHHTIKNLRRQWELQDATA